jgi:hypothetical protein
MGTRKSLHVTFKEDDSVVSPVLSTVNFIPWTGSINEINQQGQPLTIQFSRPLESEGSIEIDVNSSNAIYNKHYLTRPGAVDGKIMLTPAIGQEVTLVTIVPINNAVITGELEISLTISTTAGALNKGTQLNQVVRIADDELINKPKSYEIQAGLWGLKKRYEYDEQGKIQYVHIESTNPIKSTRTETYYYDLAGRIERINTYPHIDRWYTWMEDRIIKSETIDRGVIKEYTEYDYDAQGNVSGTANYYRQSDGQFKLGSLIVYLYFSDGNLYKSLYYIPTEGSEEYTLISTRTYEEYLATENPFPMVDILPTQKTQKQLPASFRMEENGVNLVYDFLYEFNSEGLVTKRTATTGRTSETVYYLYY